GAGRVLVAVIGLTAALALLAAPKLGAGLGWALALAWTIIQIPVYATTPDGAPNLTAANLPFGLTSSSTRNNQPTEYLQVGVNLVAIGFAIWLVWLRRRLSGNKTN